MPRDYNEVRDWADALDEKVSPTGRLMPGALYQLCTDEELLESAADTSKSTHIRIARQAYQRRLMSTPGVVGTEEMFDGAMSLQISAVDWAPGEAVSAAFETLRSDWELPDGHPVDTPSALWLAARCLVQGFYYRWDPEPPADWLYWRKEWGACQRQILKRFRDIDSPMVAAREVRSGRIPWAAPILEEWDTIKGTFKPNTVAHWIDDGAFKFCADWARKNHGIVWVNEVALGERLQREAGLPYYGRGGLCGKKEIETETGSCVASIKANSEGRNLQFQYSKNLFIAPPPGGDLMEQLLGRTHRDGQEADEVTAEFAVSCYENWKVIQQCFRDAEYIERTTSQYQKLNFADVDLPAAGDVKELGRRGDPLWDKANADYFEDEGSWTQEEQAISDLSVADRARRRSDATG